MQNVQIERYRAVLQEYYEYYQILKDKNTIS